MKTRTGFVSNSSSSSFIICKDKLTRVQRKKLRAWDGLSIVESRGHFLGICDWHEDNLRWFRGELKNMGINPRVLEWADLI